MPGLNWNLLDTNQPAKIGAAIAKADPVGSYYKGVDQAQMRQGRDQQIQSNALAMQQNRAMQPLREQRMRGQIDKGRIEQAIQGNKLRMKAASRTASAPEGAVLQTALDSATEVAGLLGGDPAEAHKKIQGIFDRVGEEGLRSSALQQSMEAKDFEAQAQQRERLGIRQGQLTLAKDRFEAAQSRTADPYRGLTPGYEEFLRVSKQQPSMESFKAYQKSEAETFKGSTKLRGLSLREQVLEEKKKIAAQKKTDSISLTPTATLDAGFRYLMTGDTPSLGRGADASKSKTAAVNMATLIADRLNIPIEERGVFKLTNAAKKSALMQLQKSQAQVGAFERTFQKNVKLARAASTKLDRSGVPIFNAWIQAGQRAVTGNTELTAFDFTMKSVVNEYTKIISGSMGNTAMAQLEIDKIEKMMGTTKTVDQSKVLFDYMKLETDNRMEGFKEENKYLRDSFLLPNSKGFKVGDELKAPIQATTPMAADNSPPAMKPIKRTGLYTVLNPQTGETEVWDLGTAKRVK